MVSAVARRIAGPYGSRLGSGGMMGMRSGGASQNTLDEMRDELEQLRGEVGELRGRVAELDDVQNRLDFAERMLAQVKEQKALPGGS